MRAWKSLRTTCITALGAWARSSFSTECHDGKRHSENTPLALLRSVERSRLNDASWEPDYKGTTMVVREWRT